MTKQIATALKYDENSSAAPKLLAKGQNEVAERIIELAKQHNIPIKEDKDLVEILSALDLDEEIPLELYSIVAEIFAFVYNINKSYKK